MEDHGREIGIGLSLKQQEQQGRGYDPSMSTQSCGCDPGYRGAVGWSVLVGHHCVNYPNCAWGKSEEVTIQMIPTQPAPYSDKSKHVGIGGAPTRATTLPEDAEERKKYPIVSGCFDYFPDALAAVANLSFAGNEQHNPGKPLHWDRSKSGDEADTLGRHLLQRGTLDKDGKRHSAKVAWRALAMLQKEIEGEK